MPLPPAVRNVTGVALHCFFFQAEDGIRDATVTGVQTCALPISAAQHKLASVRPHHDVEDRESPDDRAAGVLGGAGGGGGHGLDLIDICSVAHGRDARSTLVGPGRWGALRRAPGCHRAFLRQWVPNEALVKVGAETLGSLADLDLVARR